MERVIIFHILDVLCQNLKKIKNKMKFKHIFPEITQWYQKVVYMYETSTHIYFQFLSCSKSEIHLFIKFKLSLYSKIIIPKFILSWHVPNLMYGV